VRENEYQAHLIKVLRRRFPDCFILKNDTSYIQGIPDLMVLFGTKWAALEVKGARNAVVQPNQEYYVEKLDRMSFAAFIYPENEEGVLNDLQQTFQPRRPARVSQR